MEQEAPKQLSVDEKLDKIMEAIVFQQQLFLTSLSAMDTILADKQAKQSKIIKPIG